MSGARICLINATPTQDYSNCWGCTKLPVKPRSNYAPKALLVTVDMVAGMVATINPALHFSNLTHHRLPIASQ